MRAVVQRVSSASVKIDTGENAGYRAQILTGCLILVGVRLDDSELDANYLAQKIATLRIFEDPGGKLNLSLQDISGAALVVSNFTLYADCRKGRRPSFTEAASGELAERLYRSFGSALENLGVPTEYGIFGAEMQVSLVNDGPVTLILDSRKQF